MEESRPWLRLCDVLRPAHGSCGFHLSRTQWDPYPWVSGVDAGSPAQAAGLRPGDCVLEVNGEDVLGQRIGAIASKVRARPERVSLLLWNAGTDAASALCGGPTPLSVQRLSSCLQAVLQLLECPVCLDTVPPPAFQCCNGHLLCGGCRSRSDRCPVCRVAMGPRGRCLLADKLHALLSASLSRPPPGPEPVPLPVPTPLVQLKSRLLLQPKASSEENVCSDAGESPVRARSLSTGRIPLGTAQPPSKGCVEALFHCPRGSCCGLRLAGAQLPHHLQEAHDGPLVRYFLRPTGPVRIRLPQPGCAESISVSTPDGSTFFVQVAECAGTRLVWLWMLGDAAAAQHHRLKLTLPQSEPRTGAVFPLTSSWADVVASDSCMAIDDHFFPQNSAEVQVEILGMEGLKST